MTSVDLVTIVYGISPSPVEASHSRTVSPNWSSYGEFVSSKMSFGSLALETS